MYERIGMPKDYFTDSEVKNMEREANKNLLLFKQAFAETKDNIIEKDVSEDIQPEKHETTDDIVDIIENCVIEDSSGTYILQKLLIIYNSY